MVSLPVPNAEAMRQHLEHLFGGDLDGHHNGLIELAWTDTFPGKDGKYKLRHALMFGTDQFDELIEEAVRRNSVAYCNVYIGAALRKPETPPFGRASDDDVLALTCAYADLDDEGAGANMPLDCKPTMLVVTGLAPHARMQCWWRLIDPVTDPEELKSLIRGIAVTIGGDESVVNPSRVMRLAGSIAWAQKPGRQVELTSIMPLRDPSQVVYEVPELMRRFPVPDHNLLITGYEQSAQTAQIPQIPVSSGQFVQGEVIREATVVGLPGKVVDHRDVYMRDTAAAVLIQLIGESGRVPSPQELVNAVWVQYSAQADLNKAGKGIEAVIEKCRYTLRRFAQGRISGCRNMAQAQAIYARKKANGGIRPLAMLPPPSPHQGIDPNEFGTGPIVEILPPIDWLDMSNWDNESVPVRKWAIQDRVPLNQVGLFSGEGGSGKSIIELMKNVAHVTGTEWLGSFPEQGGAFYLGAEDEADEIHIRLHDIAKSVGVTFRELTERGLKVLPLLGQDSMLCVQSGLGGNRVEVTPLYRRLYQAAGDLKPKNISIDTLSRAFGGDEINRVQVYAFAMHMQALAKVAQGSVTILAHPSLTGISSGSGLSGSTAWHGAFRFRQYLKGIRDENADPADDDLRQLEFKKNQYGPQGRPVILRYQDGLFVPMGGATDPERVARSAKAEGVFMAAMRKTAARGDEVSHKPKSQHYAPRLFVDDQAALDLKLREQELADAMKRLLTAKRLQIETYSKNWRPQTRLILNPGS